MSLIIRCDFHDALPYIYTARCRFMCKLCPNKNIFCFSYNLHGWLHILSLLQLLHMSAFFCIFFMQKVGPDSLVNKVPCSRFEIASKGSAVAGIPLSVRAPSLGWWLSSNLFTNVIIIKAFSPHVCLHNICSVYKHALIHCVHPHNKWYMSAREAKILYVRLKWLNI